MDNKLYYKYLNDIAVFKFGELNGKYFQNIETDIEIFFAFLHRDVPQSWMMPSKRIFLETYRIRSLTPAIPKTYIDSETFILVNADNIDFAFLFKLTIDSEKREVKVIMVEEPILGESIITEEEKEGLIVPFPA